MAPMLPGDQESRAVVSCGLEVKILGTPQVATLMEMLSMAAGGLVPVLWLLYQRI